MFLESMSMRSLLRAVAADRHAAPPSRTGTRVVSEQERAGRAFAGLHVGKVLRADEPCQCLADGEQKRIGVAPSAHGLKLEGSLPVRQRRYLAEGLVASE